MRVVVGRIGRAHGIRGELTVEVRTDAPEERFSTGATLYLERHPGQGETASVASHRWQGGRMILRLVGVDDRTAAEALRGTLLEADVDVLDTADDEFHDVALVGLRVRDGAGDVLGMVTEVLHLPGQDVLVVERPGAAELLVPFVRQIVTDVDLPGGEVTVDLPAGLADLEAP